MISKAFCRLETLFLPCAQVFDFYVLDQSMAGIAALSDATMGFAQSVSYVQAVELVCTCMPCSLFLAVLFPALPKHHPFSLVAYPGRSMYRHATAS